MGYLPWEIRQGIFKAVHDGYFYGDCDLAPRTLCYEIQDPLTGPAPDIFDLDSYHTRRSRCCTSRGPIYLRLSSATLGSEYDVLFLSNTIFKFECRTGLENFLDQLSDFHQTMLRRIIISIWVPCGCRFRLWQDWRDGWKTACSQVPASLRQVSFELDYSRHWSHARSCHELGDTRRLNQFKTAATLVEVLSKTIVRNAPDAVIELHERAKKRLLPEELELFDAAVNDIER